MNDSKDTDHALISFLDMVSVKYGMHLPAQKKISIAQNGPYDAATLSEMILRTGGLNPENELRLLRQIRNAYIEAQK